MEIMLIQYGFRATQRMYKIRLKSWGCFKYARQQVALSKTKASMSMIRSPDVFRISELVMASLQEHMHVQYRSNMDNNIRYAIPDGLLRPQFIFRDTTDEIVYLLMGEVLGQKKPTVEPSWGAFVENTVADFTTSMEMISYLLDKNEVGEAFSALRHIPQKLQGMLKEEPRHILHGFFHAIVKMNWDGKGSRSMNSILTAVLKYTAALAADPSLHWSPAHPLRRIFECFTRLDTEVQLPELAIRAWKYYVDNWESPPHVAIFNSSTTRRNAHPQTITPPRSTYSRQDPAKYESLSIAERLNLNKDDIFHRSELCNPEKSRLQKKAWGEDIYQNRRSMSYAWETLGFKVSLEKYVKTILDAVQTAPQDYTVCTALLRLSTLEHVCSCWGDEENAVSIHNCILDLHKRKTWNLESATNVIEKVILHPST